MDFLKKAKSGLKDAQDINDGLKKLGFKPPSFGNKDSSKSSAPSVAPSTSYTEASTTSSVPIATPASSTVSVAGDNSVPPVPVNTGPGAITGKIPLAVRKTLRDEFENNRTDFETRLSGLLGVPWKIVIDTVGVYSYALDDYPKQNLGGAIKDYVDSATRNTKNFVETFGEDGKNELNTLANKHVLTLEPTFDKDVSYNSSAIIDGRLVMQFKNDKLGTNVGATMENLADALGKAGKGSEAPLSLAARNSIARAYDTKIEEQTNLARKYLNEPAFQFKPNFEANYASLLAFEKTLDYSDYDDQRRLRPDWASVLGESTISYFEGFTGNLKMRNFHKDDMLQEGFKEAVEKVTVGLVIQPKINKLYTELDIEDGILYIRTTPEWYWTNSTNATEAVLDIL